MKACPCCGNLTIDDSKEIITDICDVCFGQYDEVANKEPDRVIGANKVSLSTAKQILNLLEQLKNASLLWFVHHTMMKYPLNILACIGEFCWQRSHITISIKIFRLLCFYRVSNRVKTMICFCMICSYIR